MNITPVSFGTQLKYKKNYEVQKKDGTPVSKDYADKVVKRNIMLFNTAVFPVLTGSLLSLFHRGKDNLKIIWGLAAGLSLIGLLTNYGMYKIISESKDYAPQPFYKWGGFKVVEKDK